GDVTFHNDVTFNYEGTNNGVNFFISNATTDIIRFKGNATFNRNHNSYLMVARRGIVECHKNLTYNVTYASGHNYEFGYTGGLCKFTGEHPQVISSNKSELKFSKFEVNKTFNSVTLNTAIKIIPSP